MIINKKASATIISTHKKTRRKSPKMIKCKITHTVAEAKEV